MRLSFAEAGLAALDALDGVDSACLYVFEDERPLRGLAGYLDWRLCGSLSRILVDGRFVGANGDALLFPVWNRAPVARVFSFGAGKRKDLNPGAFALLARRSCQALTRAGVKGFAVHLPTLSGGDDAERAQTFLSEGAAAFKGDRIILFGESKALAKSFADAGRSMKGIEIDREALPVPGRMPSTPVARPAKAS